MKIITINNLLCIIFFLNCYQLEAQEVTRFEYDDGKVVTLSDHPRLFFTKNEEDKILELAEKSPLLLNLIDLLRKRAEDEIMSPLIEDDINLGKSRKAVSRIITLSLAYRLFDDNQYAKRVEEELINLSNYNSWHPEHFLDVAEMTTAVAIGYDWCYDQLSNKTKNAVEKSIQEKAFEPAWPVYENGDEGSWAKRNTNWNVVTNSGLVTGALAVADVYPTDAKKIIQYAAQYTPNNIEHFAPNGVYYEGPAYWGYTNIYLTLLLDNFNRILGNDFGLSSMPGVRETALYYINTLSPSKREFNFADAHGTAATLSPIYFFHSEFYNLPEVAEFYRLYMEEILFSNNKIAEYNLPRFFFLTIPWFDDANHKTGFKKPRLQIFEGEPDIAVFNGGENNSNNMYLIAKGGKPDMAHNQMDVGSFVVESQGIRWGIDLGSEDYSLPGFWDYKPDGVRWEYFRNNNLSHNTINIDGKIAYSRGRGKLSDYNLGEEPYGIFDLTPAYKGQADSVLRGFKMLSSDIMYVRDEIKLLNEGQEVNWRFFTKADATVKGNIIKLEQGDNNFFLKYLNHKNVKVEIKDAKPNSPSESSNEEVKMIQVTVESSKQNWIDISILMGNNIVDLDAVSYDNVNSLENF